MILVEILFLIIAYTLLTITLFLEIVCYKRNLETRETIAFTVSLLILIVSLTVSPLIESSPFDRATNTFTLLAMTFVGLTTPLNVLAERQHSIRPIWKSVLMCLSILLALMTVIGHFTNTLDYLQYAVVAFLGSSVVLSMILVRTTRPQKRLIQRERIERLFAIAFVVLVPLSLFTNYAFEEAYNPLHIGFTLPLIFILLSGSKLLDDLQRLGILNPTLEPKDQHFENYSLSEREKEIAILLTKGRTYKQISDELFISMPTVKTHVSNIYKKCGTNSRSKLTALLIN